MDGHVGIAMPMEEEMSFSTPGSSIGGGGSSTYGLVDDRGGGGGSVRNGGHQHHYRIRVLEKYKARFKMLGILGVVVLVIGGSAMYIGGIHESTEVIGTPEALEITIDQGTGNVGQKSDPNVFILRSKQKETPATQQNSSPLITPEGHIHDPDTQQTHLEDISKDSPRVESSTTGTVNMDMKNVSQPVLKGEPAPVSANVSKQTSMQDEGDDDGEMLGNEPEITYNPSANCTNHVKRPPKNVDSVPKAFIPLEREPIGLLEAMRECPTFSFYHCKFKEGNKQFGFKAVVHVRSTNQTHTGFGKNKRQAKKDSAYRAVLALYPSIENSALPEPEIKSRFQRAHCTPIADTDT